VWSCPRDAVAAPRAKTAKEILHTRCLLPAGASKSTNSLFPGHPRAHLGRTQQSPMCSRHGASQPSRQIAHHPLTVRQWNLRTALSMRLLRRVVLFVLRQGSSRSFSRKERNRRSPTDLPFRITSPLHCLPSTRKPEAGTSGALTALRCLSLGRSRGAAQHGASDVAGKDGQDFTANPSVKGSSCLPSRVSSGRAWR